MLNRMHLPGLSGPDIIKIVNSQHIYVLYNCISRIYFWNIYSSENLIKNPQISKGIRVFEAIKNIKLKKQVASSMKIPDFIFWPT